MIRVTQSWDDVRLVELLRKYRAKAMFNLITGAFRAECFSNRRYQNTKDVFHPACHEVTELYRDFEVASHSVTHPHLEKLARLSADPDVQWVTNLELFTPKP